MRRALEDLVVHAVVSETVLFRIVQGESPQHPVVLDGLRSNCDRGIAPRGAEVSSALIHMGLSTYRVRDKARSIARRWPRIGGYIAELRLSPDRGIWFAATGVPGHVTVWGRQRQLLACIANILPEDQR